MKKKKTIKTPLPLRIVGWLFPKVESVSQWLADRWFVNLFFTPVRYKVPTSERAAAEDANKYFLDYNKSQIQVYEWGEGEPILFVHGWMGRGTQFKKFVPKFVEAGYKVVSFDALGHGKSDGKKSHIMHFVNIIELLKKKHDFNMVVGHSIGGVALMHSLIRDRFAYKLVMIGSPATVNSIVNPFIGKLQASRKVLDYFNDYIIDMFGFPFNEFTADYIIKDLREVDLFFIHDEHDDEVSIENPLLLQSKYPEASLMTTQGLGHTRILKDDEVIEACLSFAERESEAVLTA